MGPVTEEMYLYDDMGAEDLYEVCIEQFDYLQKLINFTQKAHLLKNHSKLDGFFRYLMQSLLQLCDVASLAFETQAPISKGIFRVCEGLDKQQYHDYLAQGLPRALSLLQISYDEVFLENSPVEFVHCLDEIQYLLLDMAHAYDEYQRALSESLVTTLDQDACHETTSRCLGATA